MKPALPLLRQTGMKPVLLVLLVALAGCGAGGAAAGAAQSSPVGGHPVSSAASTRGICSRASTRPGLANAKRTN